MQIISLSTTDKYGPLAPIGLLLMYCSSTVMVLPEGVYSLLPLSKHLKAPPPYCYLLN